MKIGIVSGFRFLLVLPAAVSSWVAVFLLGLFTEYSVRRHFCSGAYERGAKLTCYSTYAEDISFGLMVFFTGLSAIAVVTTSIYVAPSQKFRVGVIMYVAGALTASVMALSFSWILWLSAILSGLLPLVLLKGKIAKLGVHSL